MFKLDQFVNGNVTINVVNMRKFMVDNVDDRVAMISYVKLDYNAVVDSYEPGSTFKIAVASMAIEEKVLSPNETFYCGGSIQ